MAVDSSLQDCGGIREYSRVGAARSRANVRRKKYWAARRGSCIVTRHGLALAHCCSVCDPARANDTASACCCGVRPTRRRKNTFAFTRSMVGLTCPSSARHVRIFLSEVMMTRPRSARDSPRRDRVLTGRSIGPPGRLRQMSNLRTEADGGSDYRDQ